MWQISKYNYLYKNVRMLPENFASDSNLFTEQRL